MFWTHDGSAQGKNKIGRGNVQESEVTSAAWYPLDVAEALVGRHVARVSSAPRRIG